MSEVQAHGITRETQIRASGLLTSNPGKNEYTSAVDFPAGYSANPENKNLPIQYKTVLGKSLSAKSGDLEGHVMLADAIRNHDCEHIELMVEVLQQSGSIKNSLGIVRMVFKKDRYGAKIFGTLPKDDLLAINRRVKDVPLGLTKEQYKLLSKAIRFDIAKLASAHGCKATIQPKISTSDSQRRVQCGCKLSTLKSLADHWDFIQPSQLQALGLPSFLDSTPRK